MNLTVLSGSHSDVHMIHNRSYPVTAHILPYHSTDPITAQILPAISQPRFPTLPTILVSIEKQVQPAHYLSLHAHNIGLNREASATCSLPVSLHAHPSLCLCWWQNHRALPREAVSQKCLAICCSAWYLAATSLFYDKNQPEGWMDDSMHQLRSGIVIVKCTAPNILDNLNNPLSMRF
jgi:hypothetical protein